MKRVNDIAKARQGKLDYFNDAFDDLGIDLPDMVKSSRASMANIGMFLIKSELFDHDEIKLLMATGDLEEPAVLDERDADPEAIDQALKRARSPR
ncbi:MAG: hypothetical protein H0S85_07585 [Desulfovibrionaceae bacterium]|jgi:hypothetical protein|nr:hypothetical protein [Desulfovibrionaceae bacterium]